MSLFVDIRKDFGDFCLTSSFETNQEVTGILGASGCGKSMTLRCIAGIERPDSGRIVLNGVTLYDSERGIDLPPQKRRVGYLFQNYALFPNMTVVENIRCGLRHVKDRRLQDQRISEMLERFMLKGLEQHKPDALSGGQQQRCALARILVNEPDILLLDEPFSALDSFLRVQLQTEMKKLLKSYGKDVILVTHDRDEAYHLCEQLMIMDSGRVLKKGSIKEVFATPGCRQAARLTGCKNIVEAVKASEHEVYVPSWRMTLKCSRAVEDGLCAIGIRAHYFNTTVRENVFPVELVDEMEEPFEWIYRFRYTSADEDSPTVWWRVTKEKKFQAFPKELGVSPANVMLLYE